ncbi:MAG: YjhX family toxin [Rhodospirillaceae bacterium]|nr:YjhX family toxin [Rhodospirillaceae bacterium]
MNISKAEQRVLHVLAQGGLIRHERDEGGRIAEVHCFTRDGFCMAEFDLPLFRRLKKRRLISSRQGRPYRITRRGLDTVRAQLDNR